jgi:hypothetical protein
MKLPEPVPVAIVFATGEEIPGYTVEQMLAWGKACAAAEREEILNLAKEHAAKYKLGGFFYPLMNIHITRAAATACDHVAHHIRARGTT